MKKVSFFDEGKRSELKGQRDKTDKSKKREKENSEQEGEKIEFV